MRPIGHEDRLSIVDHLDELRTRLFICLAALAVAFAVCFWQNGQLLHLLNKPLPTQTASNHLNGLTGDTVKLGRALAAMETPFKELAASPKQPPADRQSYAVLARDAAEAAAALPRKEPPTLPITIGVGETFTTTITIAAYFALLFALPVILYQLYGFVFPALKPNERRVATPVMLTAPLLFLVGVVFTYVIVLPAAVHFLQGYNSQNFNNLVQARSFYTFEILTMLGIGLAFQLPLVLLALQAIGVINARTLTKNWRYATVIIAVIAAAMPGADPVTTGLEMAPLVLLYLASIVLLRISDRRAAARAAAEIHLGGDGLDIT
jgi:sec-independent protein translocase protein TatC